MKNLRIFLLIGFLVSGIQSAGAQEAACQPGAEAIKKTARQILIGRPFHYKNLTIFPLILEEAADPADCLSLDEAVEKGYLRITELDGGTVPRLSVVNKGERKVFIMAGEVLVGCNQDRMSAADVMVPGYGKVVLPVYCVEESRWTQRSDLFSSGGTSAPSGLRSEAYKTAPQSQVWSLVAEKRGGFSVSNASSSLQGVYECREVESENEDYADKFEQMPDLKPGMSGCVVAVGRRIICADIFSDRGIFRDLYPKLLKSYVLDALVPVADSGNEPSTEDVRIFIRSLLDAEYAAARTAGPGNAYSISGNGVSGGAFSFKGFVHISLFREAEKKPAVYQPGFADPRIIID